MDFTRQPIIESIITPKEGYKLVIRSSKGAGHEEFFVDSVEVVSFGYTFFLRSLERPKSFLVPASDYEILEVRETRMVLKNVGIDSSIKIAGGKEPSAKKEEKAPQPSKEVAETDEKGDKKRDRRRQSRRRRGREEGDVKETTTEEVVPAAGEPVKAKEETAPVAAPRAPMSALLPPPSTLISETIARYKGDQLFKDVFFPKGEEQTAEEADEEETASFLQQTDEVEITSADPFNIADDEDPIKEDLFNIADDEESQNDDSFNLSNDETSSPTTNHDGEL